MISVLIPIYNFDCSALLQSLAMQAVLLGVEYEIIAFEDGSASFLKENTKAAELYNIKYTQRENNVGRSAIRNLLAKEAKYEYLIFLDCDVTPSYDNFLSIYILHIEQNKNVDIIYGGRAVINKEAVEDERILNWKTCYFRESKNGMHNGYTKNITETNQPNNANHHFLTNNFLIRKAIFNDISFNEELKGYGHEDTLFGLDALAKGYDISFIDNPVCCQHLETNEDFLAKTRTSLENLSWIIDHHPEAQKINLVNKYNLLKSMYFDKVISPIFIASHSQLEKRIIKKPSLYLFDLYKLGYLCMLRNKQ